MVGRLALSALTLAAAVGFGPRVIAAPAETQWFYAAATPVGPTAIFLDWTYSSVVVRAHCDQKAGEIVFIAPQDAQFRAAPKMALILGDRTFPMLTKRLDDAQRMALAVTVEQALVGRLKLGPAIVASLARAPEIDLDAPNEMDEAWHLGRAEALRRVVAACRGTTRRR